MQLPKLSPLQSRLVASLAASITLLVIIYALSSPLLAYAAEIDSFRAEDHNHERLALEQHLYGSDNDAYDELDLREVQYEAEFVGVDRGIIGRAPAGVTALENNVPATINIPLGSTVQYMFQNSSLWGALSPVPSGLPSSSRVVMRNAGEEVDDLNTRSPGAPNGTYALEKESELKSRQSEETRTLYISVNTCLQPTADDSTSGAPPQLQLYLSTNSENTSPGPDQEDDFPGQIVQELDGGAIVYTLNATGDVYIGVYAPNATGYSSVYSASIAASIDAPFHYYNGSTPNLYLVDSDANAALLVTNNLTSAANGSSFDEWMNLSPPYVMFANSMNDTSIDGVKNSYCGLENYAQIAAMKSDALTNDVQMSMTDRGSGSLPKEQFFFGGLNKSSGYIGILAMNGNSTDSGAGVVGGGGTVFKSMNFTTPSEENCAVLYDLSFCKDVAYAVPSNQKTFPTLDELAAFYDNATQAQYKYFEYSLQQIACETTSSAQYSLVRSCDDCAAAYKSWLCSVTIPRCTDFSSTLSWLQDRNIQQAFPNGTKLPQEEIQAIGMSAAVTQSRNPNIDTVVQPGPYKEVLPCEDLCYNLVQSCPAAMGFSCPQPGQTGFDTSYGQLPNGSAEQSGQITCNYPGAAYYLSAAHRATAVPALWLGAASTIFAVAVTLIP